MRDRLTDLARRWWVFPAVLFLVTRLGLVGVAYVGEKLMPSPRTPHEFPTQFLRPYPALDGFCRWDCGWYEKIATLGYSEPIDTAFWPGYPLLARAVHEVTRLHIQLGMLIVANGMAFLAFLLIYRIFQRLTDDAAARWGLAVFAAYPFAFYQSAGYAESSMIALTAAAVLLALQRRHLSAGLVLAAAVAVRHLSVIATLTLLIAQIRDRGASLRRLLLSPSILALLLPPAAFAAYACYCWVKFGNPWTFWNVRREWAYAGISVIDLFIKDVKVPRLYFYFTFSLIPMVGAYALLRRRNLDELAAFGAPLMMTIWAIGAVGLGRASAACWPAFLPLGSFLARRPGLQAGVVVALALVQGMAFYLFVHNYPMT